MAEILLCIFTIVDDFYSVFAHQLSAPCLVATKHTGRKPAMTVSEIMTIEIAFQCSGFRNFKKFYVYLEEHCRTEFPNLVSYPRFVTLKKSILLPLVAFFEFVKGSETGLYFIDSTPISVCKNKRIFSHKVFDGLAQRGKNTMGWFFGFKLHLVCNERAEPISFRLTPGNTDDRKAAAKVLKDLFGKVVGDKGYISKDLFVQLFKGGLRIVTSLKANMKAQLVTLEDTFDLNKRSLIESTFNVLKNSMFLEHSRHRSVSNFMVNILGTLAAYALRGINGSDFPEKCAKKFSLLN
jgi:hypothetical protein